MQIEQALDYISEIIRQAEAHGSTTTPGGAQLLGRVPAVAPEAFLHCLFPPLEESGLAAVEAEVERPLPESFRGLLRRTNGMNLFGASLSVFGLRTSYSRTTPERYPFSARTANTVERPHGLPPLAVVVASYGDDGSLVYIGPNGAAVRCDRDTGAALNHWRSLAEMLGAEVTRMNQHVNLSDPLPQSVWHLPPPAAAERGASANR